MRPSSKAASPASRVARRRPSFLRGWLPAFAIYPAIRRGTRRRECGVHLKTAGTTWLEEAAGLAESGDQGLAIVKEVYAQCLARFDELCAPYAAVIAIDRTQLPSLETVAGWEGWRFAQALRHSHSACPEFNPHLRQLLQPPIRSQ